MALRISVPALWLVLAAIIILTGCQTEQQKQDKLLAYGPDVDSIRVNNDYTPRAIGATGGYDAWIDTAKLELTAIVTFYRPDNSFYLTEHQYKIYPWSNSIVISAKEPAGDSVWRLSKGKFKIIEGHRADEILPQLSYVDFAAIVLDIVTAPVRFLDKSSSFVEISELVKKYGRWYYKIERTAALEGPDWSQTIFYQSRDTLLIDTLWFTKPPHGRAFAVRAYDYRKPAGARILVPSKIEIFQTSLYGALRRRLAAIDIK